MVWLCGLEETGQCPCFLRNGGCSRTLIVLAMVWVSAEALCERVSRVPVRGEVGVREAQVAGVDVLRQSRLSVCADGLALVAVFGLLVKIFGIDGSEDVETVAVVGGDEDQGILQRVGLVQMVDRGFDGVVQLEEFAESAVVVEDVHHLVDGGGLGHEKPAFVASAVVEDVDGFESHILETRLVRSICLVASRRVLVATGVVRVHIAVQPLRHVGDGEQTESLFIGVSSFQLRQVLDQVVARILEDLVVVEVSVGKRAWCLELRVAKVLCTAAEEDIRAIPLGPGVVYNAMNEGVHDVTILAAVSGVRSKGSRGCIGQVRRAHDSNVSSVHAMEDLRNGLNFGVVERIWGGVGIDAHSVDARLVAGVQCAC